MGYHYYLVAPLFTNLLSKPKPIDLSLYIFSGKDEPKAPSMHIKPKDPRAFVTPSPCAYNPEGADKDVRKMAPKYSFGIKGKDDKIKDVPGKT